MVHLKHRVIWLIVYGKWPDGLVDHINRNAVDNRLFNLRDVSASENQHNRGAKGFSFDKRTGKYKSSISINYKSKFLGYFDTDVDARNAYLIAKKILHPSAPI